MDRCLSESALDLEHLHVEIAARNGQQVDWLCHRLMGRAMMYGMVELSEVLQRLDTTFRLDQPELADALVDGADRALERFRQDLSS